MTRSSGADSESLGPGWWIAQLALLALAAYQLEDVVGCQSGCFADLEALFGPRVAGLSLADMQLNSWILAWSQHALGTAPGSLFDANAFHPADMGLTGSEHMLGISLVLLPTRLLGPSAVGLHQAATVLSFLIMGWSTFALARWTTGSIWAAFIAAAVAMFMPWRIFELGRVQLLSAHWIPLVWLLVAKISAGEATRRTAPLLALVLLLQLASSYYLAYFVSASVGVLVLVLLWRDGVQRSRLVHLVAALTAAFVPFVLLSLPYLQRDAAADLVLAGGADRETTLAEVGAFLLGNSPGAVGEVTRMTYHIPLCILFLAGLGVLLARIRRSPPDVADRRVATLSIGLWMIVLTSVIFWLGNQLQIGDVVIDLPGRLAAAWIPGFDHLRAAARWMLLVGIAAPLLAAIGVHRAEQFAERAGGTRVQTTRAGLRIAVCAMLLLGMGWDTIPTRPVTLDGSTPAYEALRDLPPGPVLELPWPGGTLHDALSGSRYMLASTLHWKPILNGFAPYPPHTYDYLRRLSWRLPSQDALERLTQLAGLRWVVLHVQKIPRSTRRRWEDLIEGGVLRRPFRDSTTWVLEIVERDAANSLLDRFKSGEPRGRTLTGLSRDRLVVPPGSSQLAVELPETLSGGIMGETFVEATVQIENGTAQAWPGFDIQTDGLVQLHHEFVAADGTISTEGFSALYADVPANGSLAANAFIAPPEQPGQYILRFALVQRLQDDAFEELDVPRVERRVTVSRKVAVSRKLPASREVTHRGISGLTPLEGAWQDPQPPRRLLSDSSDDSRGANVSRRSVQS